MRQTKARALGGDLRQRVQEVARRARQAVEARDGERVALAKLRENAGKLGAVGLRSASRRAGHNHRSEGPSRARIIARGVSFPAVDRDFIKSHARPRELTMIDIDNDDIKSGLC